MAGFLYLLVWLQMKINRYMHKLFSEFTTLPLLNVQIKITSWDHKVFHKLFSFEFLFKVPSKIFGYWEIWTQPFCKSYLWFCEKMLRKEILEIRSWTVTAFLMYPRFLWWLQKIQGISQLEFFMSHQASEFPCICLASVASDLSPIQRRKYYNIKKAIVKVDSITLRNPDWLQFISDYPWWWVDNQCVFQLVSKVYM